MVADDGRLGGRRRAGGLSLVDIVAVMIDGIEIGFAADMAPGGEEAAFVMLAARDRDAQAIERRAGGGRSAHRTGVAARSEEHTSELQSLMRISYAVFCLKKKKT